METPDQAQQTYSPDDWLLQLLRLAPAPGERVAALLNDGADPNARDNSAGKPRGPTALMWAAFYGGVSMPSGRSAIGTLLDAGAEVNEWDNKGETALIWAVRGGHPEAVRELLEAKALPNMSMNEHQGHTALMMWAITDEQADKKDEEEVLKLLLDAGADVTACNMNQQTACDLATGLGHEDKAGKLRACEIVRKLSGKRTVAEVFHAARESVKQAEDSRRKLAPGGPEAARGQEMFDLLQRSDAAGEVKRLLDEGVDPNATGCSAEIPTPTLMAAVHGRVESLKLLVQAGGDVNMPVNGGRALVLAAKWGDTKTMQVLLAAKTDINAQTDQWHNTALILAAACGRNEAVDLLLDAGANANLQNVEGTTALIVAAAKGHHELVARLLRADRVDLDARDKDGHTAMMWAAGHGHKQIVCDLAEAGATLDLKGKDQKTAYLLAKKKDHPETAREIARLTSGRALRIEPVMQEDISQDEPEAVGPGAC